MSGYDKTITGLTALVILWGLLYMLPLGIMEATTRADCLRAGYRDSKVDMFFNAYCINRVNQTDVIVPWENRRD